MGIVVRRFEATSWEAWTHFVEHANEGTIFHRLDFLQYHGERFSQHEHHLAWYKGQTLFGIIPMAIFEEEYGRAARSHTALATAALCFASRSTIPTATRLLGAC